MQYVVKETINLSIQSLGFLMSSAIASVDIACTSRDPELYCRVLPFLSYQTDYLEWDRNNNIR